MGPLPRRCRPVRRPRRSERQVLAGAAGRCPEFKVSPRARTAVETLLQVSVKRWRLDSVVADANGMTAIEYVLTPKKNKSPDELLTLVRTGGVELYEAEIQ